MASYDIRPKKDGSISYLIRVSRGRDTNKKRLSDYTMTWTPSPGMSPGRVEKALLQEIAAFEQKCKTGQVPVQQFKFLPYANYVLEQKIRGGLKLRSQEAWQYALDRIPRSLAT